MSDKEIIAAVGAGRMGRGMAIAFAYSGHHVRLVDAKPRSAAEFETLQTAALSEIRSALGLLAGFGLLEEHEIEGVAARVQCYPLIRMESALDGVPVIFEGVPETLEAKREAFATICRYADEEAIIASTTSTILSNDLQGFVTHPKRFLNAHWLNPAYLVPLVEVSPAEQTAPQTTRTLKALLERIGKVPVVCAASPGYIVPRIQALAMNEAARLVEEGVASAEDIDKATKYGFGFRFAVLGLLEFIDWGGGDILFYASRYMSDATGQDRFEAPKIVQQNMANNRNGLRDGEGFMTYEGMDVAAYQKERIGAFAAMLRHLDKMPVKG
ncbi:3-hydroxybutyryl-CoA dehydrogenase [uncultured Sulfitobacter sp.]|uniref:3-hydroxybutyryl-CoA dehydrogenase n=1 Tax=uncultured Sulfitobacter sp. TaxID=191468 RepID=UPI0026096CC8|nr:3-hydroxybutyryl-CoA dehydrogenase [uncultured Sulfitobacter sp.]